MLNSKNNGGWIEALERRALLSVSLDGTGGLNVEGSDAIDNVVVDVRSGATSTVTMNGTTYTFTNKVIARVSVRVYGGNDDVTTIIRDGEFQPIYDLPVTILGGNGNDKIDGQNGAKTIDAGSGNDSVEVFDGTSTVFGGDGNDILQTDGYAGPTAATVHGGNGDDRLFAHLDSADTFYGDAGTDELQIVGGGGAVRIILDGVRNDGYNISLSDNYMPDIEILNGTEGEDYIVGSDVDNIINSYGYQDTLFGGGGNDTIYTGPYDDYVDAGAGDDTIDASAGDHDADTIIGGAGSDTVTYSRRSDNLKLSIGDGANDGGEGETDDIRADVEKVRGGSGDDLIVGSSAANALWGNGGNDTLRGSGAVDALWGGAGNDVLDGGTGGDYLAGEAGNDTADYGMRFSAVKVSLDGVANDGETGEADNALADIENVNGGSGADLLVGNASNNILRGNAGNDTVHGGNGNDILSGGNGADQLFGEAGNDQLYGRDTVKDILDGGSGTDQAQKDDKDSVLNVESFIA